MQKPKGYDEVTVNTAYTPLEVGGHYLTIMDARETLSKSGLKMLEISYDTAANDKQPGYYRADWNGRKDNANASWQGKSYIVLPENYGASEERYGWSSKTLKQFITSVEHSLDGWTFDWNVASLKGKKVGGTFGEEDFMTNEGKVLTSVKLRWWCSVSEVPSQSIPKKKELKTENRPAPAPDYNSALPFDL